MLNLIQDIEAFAKEVGVDVLELWTEFKSFVRNKPVEVTVEAVATPVEAAPVVEPVAEAAIDVVS